MNAAEASIPPETDAGANETYQENATQPPDLRESLVARRAEAHSRLTSVNGMLRDLEGRAANLAREVTKLDQMISLLEDDDGPNSK